MRQGNSFVGQPFSRRTVLGAGLGVALVAETGALVRAHAHAHALAGVSGYRVVTASVANLWTAPSAPRPVDALMLRPNPNVSAWLRALDAMPRLTGRLGLHGRLETQLRRGEPIIVVRTLRNGWTQVACPWHPRTPKATGYVGWLAPGQVSRAPWRGATRGGVPMVTSPRRPTGFLTTARAMTRVPYLWGGATPYGVDCSGLVLVAARAVGVQVPRDAGDQFTASRRISMAEVRPGDLYFFAHSGKAAHHVGIATRPGWMLNAPSTGTRVREERLTARQGTLAGAGRYAGLS